FEETRYRIAFYGSTRTYSGVLALHGWDAAAEKLHALSKQGKWPEMAGVVTDEMVEAFTAVAPYEQLAKRVGERFGGLSDRIALIELDATSAASVGRAFETVSGHGPVDVLVNNAGIGGASPLELTPEDEHRRMFETNYFGAIRCIQAVLPAMRERRRGTIVNVTSIAGRVATPNQIAYSASKWALECAGEALAHEVRRFGIRVVNVEPGVVMTSIFENS